jgi:hypothetical protein
MLHLFATWGLRSQAWSFPFSIFAPQLDSSKWFEVPVPFALSDWTCQKQLLKVLHSSHVPLCHAVTMQAQREYPPDMQCKDKFLVQSVISEIGSPKDITPDLVSDLSKSAGRILHQISATVTSEVRSSISELNNNAVHLRERERSFLLSILPRQCLLEASKLWYCQFCFG